MFERWRGLRLPDCWLVAGAVVQTYWNWAHGFPAEHGIRDVDLAYFDPGDLTEQTEVSHGVRIERLYEHLGVRLDVKNEARVHLWYEGKFGYPIAPYSSVEAAIETFPTTAGAIGVRPMGNQLEAIAPFGFDDLLNLVVKPNKRQITPAIYAAKVRRWQARWPRLKIRPWNES